MAATQKASIPEQILTLYSQKAELFARPFLAFRRFVQVKEEFGKQPGQTIQFLRLGALARGRRLSETDSMPVQMMKNSTYQITMYEWGNSVLVSAQSARFSFRDVMSDASRLLGEDFAIVVDEYLRDTYMTSANVLYAGGAANDAALNPADPTHLFTTDIIKDAVEVLKLLNVRPLGRAGDSPAYICFAHPHQLRDLRDDGAWLDATKYTNPRNIYYGEAGRYENVVFIETTQMPISAGVGVGGADVYAALMFGDRAVGFGESVPVKMTTDGVIDHGRWLSLGWWGIHGSGIMNDFIVQMHTA